MSDPTRGASKEFRQAYRRLATLGCALDRTRAGHVRVRFPDGRQGSFPLTSTNRHTLRRLHMEARRLAA